MTTLHLGVNDIPYDAGDKTTGDVADILEAKYGVMQNFVDLLGEDIIQRAFTESAGNALEAVVMGAPATISLTGDAEQELEIAFHLFIEQQEMDFRVDGVPTKASLNGVNHRLKNPYAKTNSSRPSFRDTGQYLASFRAWVD